MKQLMKTIVIIVAMLSLTGCANSVRKVSVEDPVIMAADEARFQELDDYFNSRYAESDFTDIKNDPLYEEWRLLDPLGYVEGKGATTKGRAFATVDLANQTYTYEEETYAYAEQGDEIVIKDKFEGIDQETIPKLIRTAKKDKQADQDHNNRLLLQTLWMPIVLTIIGVLSIMRPDIIWFWEDGRKYKDAAPSDMSLNLNVLRGVLSIGLALVILFFIYRALLL